MTHAPLHWQAEALWEALHPVLPGLTIEVRPHIDSTNSELMRRARAGQYDPTLLVTEAQTAGRGRRGRTWHSSTTTPGAALTFSLGLPLAPVDWSGLSLAVGLCVAEALPTTPALGLKWPNDLWLPDDRKLGGILVETASMPAAAGSTVAPRYLVVGIGLNVQPCTVPDLQHSTACLADIAPALTAPQALQHIAPALVAMLQGFAQTGFAPLQARYAARDVLQGRVVQLSDGTTGTALGVAPDGALRVLTPQGLQTITSDDVSVRPSTPVPLPPAA
jgi:BirA family biotin operon repressor/biotin-[acetyl-CoA-carboxylase] ligase